MNASVRLKKFFGRETKGTWPQYELIGGKPPVLE
jgi:hypothetical protein